MLSIKNTVLFVATIGFVYLSFTLFLHSLTKLRNDFEPHKSFDDPAVLEAISRERFGTLREVKVQNNISLPQITRIIEPKRKVIVEEEPKTLFNEGHGVPAFQFKKEAVGGRNHDKRGKESHQSVLRRDVGVAKDRRSDGGTSKFGLPLTPPLKVRGNMDSLHGRKSVTEVNSETIHQKSSIASSLDNKGQDETWYKGLVHKLACLQKGCGGVFLYHVRKAAGTSIRDVLEQACKRWRVSLFETEGLTLDSTFLSHGSSGGGLGSVPGGGGTLLSVTTLRDPVQRAISMYWYEHVGWWDGIQKKTEKCHTLSDWVATWRDDSPWKKDFMKKNPRSVYVEIENYYVKMLMGWTGEHVDGKLNESHLSKAKQVLNSFDVILLTEWMEDASQIDAQNALFPGRSTIATKHMLKGDKKAKERLQSKLAPNEDDIKTLLKKMNYLDLQLWEYAQSLVAKRVKIIPKLVKEAKTIAESYSGDCGKRVNNLPRALREQLGIHQPPGHKAPL